LLEKLRFIKCTVKLCHNLDFRGCLAIFFVNYHVVKRILHSLTFQSTFNIHFILVLSNSSEIKKVGKCVCLYFDVIKTYCTVYYSKYNGSLG